MERSPCTEAMSQKAKPKRSQERIKESVKMTSIQRQRMSTQVVKRSLRYRWPLSLMLTKVTLQRPSLPTKRCRGRRFERLLRCRLVVEGEDRESWSDEEHPSPLPPSLPPLVFLGPEHIPPALTLTSPPASLPAGSSIALWFHALLVLL